jgi:hypothetical protein
MMTEDEVVREVRAAREAFAASHGYDIRAMVAALREAGIASGREMVRLAPRPAQRPNQTSQQIGAATPLPGTSSLTEAAPAAEL